MKHKTNCKLVRVVEHLISLTPRDIAVLISSHGDRAVTQRDIDLVATVSSDAGPTAVEAETLLAWAREFNEDIPDEAETVLAVRWQEESDAGVPPPAQIVLPSAATAVPSIAASGAICSSCGGVPDLHGPTPECEDAAGCGRVRRLKGDLPIPKTVTTEERMPDYPVKGASVLVNRETGKTAFAAANGAPYGVAHDYHSD